MAPQQRGFFYCPCAVPETMAQATEALAKADRSLINFFVSVFNNKGECFSLICTIVYFHF
jgi:hypothetical protein